MEVSNARLSVKTFNLSSILVNVHMKARQMVILGEEHVLEDS